MRASTSDLTAAWVMSTSPGSSAYSISRSTLFMFISSSVLIRVIIASRIVMLDTDVSASPASPAVTCVTHGVKRCFMRPHAGGRISQRFCSTLSTHGQRTAS